MEVQVHGTTNTKDEFELKLRAAGASTPEKFTVEETVFTIPSISGAVQGQVRLFPSPSSSTLAISGAENENWILAHEAEVLVDKEDMVRVVNLDRVELKGNAEEVLKHLGFTEGFRLGRNGSRVSLPGGWIVEYFGLFDPKASSTSSRKRASYVLEKGSTGLLLVTIKRQFDNEKEAQANVTDAWRVIRRIMPEFQPVTYLTMTGRRET